MLPTSALVTAILVVVTLWAASFAVGSALALALLVGRRISRPWSVSFAERCAWRATYLRFRGRVIAQVGFDPTRESGPVVWVGVMGRIVRRRVPCLRWQVGMGPVRLALYRRQAALLHRLDGRFVEQRRAARPATA